MTKYRKETESETDALVKIAHRLMDGISHDDDGEEILRAAHAIRGKTIRGSLPEGHILGDLERLLDSLSIKFAVIGGIALTLHGQTRDTQDIDILVSEMPPREKLRDADFMRQYNFYRASSSTGTMVTIDHRQNGQVELLLANSPLREWALSSATHEMIIGQKAPVVNASALIGLKAEAYADNSSRTQDVADIVSVLTQSNPSMDEVRKLMSEKALAVLDGIRVRAV